jgi:hypothetical protein
MSNIADIYTRELHSQLKYYATWLPGTPLKLGDYGTLNGRLFTKTGNILADFDIKIKVGHDKLRDNFSYKSASGVTVNCQIVGSGTVSVVAELTANVKVGFSKGNGIFFFADGCVCDSISNKKTIGEYLDKLPSWDSQNFIITELVTSGATTILISNASNGEVSFNVKGNDISVANFASAGMKLSVQSEKQIGFSIIAKDGLTPLFKLYQFNKKIFRKKRTFRPKAKKK